MFVGGWRKERSNLLFPAFGLGKATGGAEAGFTGMEHFLLRPARRAFEEVKAHCLRTAGKHFRDIFADRGALEKVLVFLRNELPVVGKDVF
jgi:hypothetical protein